MFRITPENIVKIETCLKMFGCLNGQEELHSVEPYLDSVEGLCNSSSPSLRASVLAESNVIRAKLHRFRRRDAEIRSNGPRSQEASKLTGNTEFEHIRSNVSDSVESVRAFGRIFIEISAAFCFRELIS